MELEPRRSTKYHTCQEGEVCRVSEALAATMAVGITSYALRRKTSPIQLCQ